MGIKGYFLTVRAVYKAMRGTPLEVVYPLLKKAFLAGGMPVERKVQLAYLGLKYEDPELVNQVLRSLESSSGQKPKEIRAKKNAHVYRALYLWKQGDLNKAWETIYEVYDSGFRTVNLYGTWGFLALESQESQKALDYCKEALDYDGEDKVILDNWGTALLKNGKVKEARAVYSELLAKNPRFPEAWFNGAQVEMKYEKKKALELVDKALELPFNGLTTIKKSQVENLKKELEASLG